MKPEDYLEAITQELLKASAMYKSLFPRVLFRGIQKDDEIILKEVKQHLDAASTVVERMLQNTNNPYAYVVILDVFGTKQHIECDSKEATIELVDNFHGDDGKAYIFTNDLSVGGRDEKVGGTIICESQDDVYAKADAMYRSK